jgi:hypothetical protein
LGEAGSGSAGGSTCNFHLLTHRAVVTTLLFIVIKLIGSKGLFVLYGFALPTIELARVLRKLLFVCH